MSTSGSNQLTSKSSDLRSLATKIAANNPPAQPNPASRSPEPTGAIPHSKPGTLGKFGSTRYAAAVGCYAVGDGMRSGGSQVVPGAACSNEDLSV